MFISKEVRVVTIPELPKAKLVVPMVVAQYVGKVKGKFEED